MNVGVGLPTTVPGATGELLLEWARRADDGPFSSVATLDRVGIDVSSGSACSASTPEPSHVLLAMGLSRRDALSAVRYSLSRLTTSAEIDRAVAATIEAVETLRTSARR